jgi:hypothetical protein
MLWYRVRPQRPLACIYRMTRWLQLGFCDSEIADKPLQGRESIVPCCQAPWIVTTLESARVHRHLRPGGAHSIKRGRSLRDPISTLGVSAISRLVW